MLVRPVIMDCEHIVPLVAVFAALEEMLRPVHRDVAHLVDRHIGREREQHVRGKAELGRAAPGPGPILDNVFLLLLRKHRRIGQRVGHRRIGVDRLVVDIGDLRPKRGTRLAAPGPDPFEDCCPALTRRRLQRVARRHGSDARETPPLPTPRQPRVDPRRGPAPDALILPETAHDRGIEGEGISHS